LFTLISVFRVLDDIPTQFVIFIELRGADGSVRIRCRVPGMTGDTGTWYESWDELALHDGDAHTIVFPLENVDPPEGRSVVEAMIDGRVAGTRVVDFSR